MDERLKVQRDAINAADRQIMAQFAKRMQAAQEIAAIKQELNLPIQDDAREDIVVESARQHIGEAFAGEGAELARTMMALSKARQRRALHGASLLLPTFVEPTAVSKVAFQGVRGAFSEAATIKLYPQAEAVNRDTFEDVFAAVRDGQVEVGVVPIENSLSGAINEVYDLLRRYGCYIVAEEVLPVSQCLLGLPDADIRDIRTVRSHPEALKQCRQIIRDSDWKSETSANTAIAAQSVKAEGDPALAAIGSIRAAEIYGLKVLKENIQGARNNKTRFVALRASAQMAPDADRLALTFVTKHQPGALADTMLAFAGAKLNLARILSQPDGSGGYRFFIDVEGSLKETAMREALSHAANTCEYFEILGIYKGA